MEADFMRKRVIELEHGGKAEGSEAGCGKSPNARIASWRPAPGSKTTEATTHTLGPDPYQADHRHSQRRSWRARARLPRGGLPF